MLANEKEDLLQQWRAFFKGPIHELAPEGLEKISHLAMASIGTYNVRSAPEILASFCKSAGSRDFVLEAARLRSVSQFPPVLSENPGTILGSRLVLNWNILLVQEEDIRFLVIQGVTSCDAIIIPTLDIVVLVCHVDSQRVADCLTILCRSPDFFQASQAARFGGYLVGHSRPYHCFYDSFLALEAIRQAGLLTDEDSLYSKADETFIDLGIVLHLQQGHQQLSRDSLNQICQAENVYLLQLGFWFHTGAEDPALRQLATTFDAPIRSAAVEHSELARIGAVGILEQFRPLIWVGITGQKRCWIEQVEGTADLLNTLHDYYPKLGIVFDGWTPPLTGSDYHRKEARNDDRIIQRIIRRLRFKTRDNVGILAGLPLLEKVRVAHATDAFVANYTSGSLNIARICGKPGVGHMGRRMMASKHQHIHHRTCEVDPQLVTDVGDANIPTGYVNYSLAWQALYNVLIEVLADIPVAPQRQPQPLPIPGA